MIGIEKDLPDLNYSRKLNISNMFYQQPTPILAKSHSVEFIPFFQERDSMGRLINTANMQKRLSMGSPMVQSVTFQDLRGQNEKKQRAMDSFFRKVDLESRQLLRSSFSPKKPFIVVKKNLLEPMESYDLSKGLNLIKERNKSVTIKPIALQKIQSQNDLNKNQSYLSNQSRKMSKIEILSKNQKKVSKSVPLKEKKLGPANLLSSLKVKISTDNPQFRKHKQRQAMSLKVFTDYQDGHERFKQKMKQSKRIAHRIKKQLQLD